MQEVPGREPEGKGTESESGSVMDALGSEDPEVRASAFNATLSLLFRLNGLTQKRQTQEQIDRQTALIQLPVAEALQSEDVWTRDRAGGVMQGLLATLGEVTRKKQRVEQMIDQLRDEINAMRRARRAQSVRSFLLLLGVLLLFCTQGFRVFQFWWMVFPLSGFWAAERSRGLATVQRLSEAWDPRAVGVLAVVAQERDDQVSAQAQEALLNLLPRVRASDAAYVDREGMQALIELLKEDDDALRMALLQALEQIGDERAIPIVMDLRDTPRISRAIRQAAAECLPALENRVRLARDSATLLRASSGLNASQAAAVLLRPAGGTPVAADNLLRPSGNASPTPSTQTEATEPSLFLAKSPSESVSDDTTLRSGTSLS